MNLWNLQVFKLHKRQVQQMKLEEGRGNSLTWKYCIGYPCDKAPQQWVWFSLNLGPPIIIK